MRHRLVLNGMMWALILLFGASLSADQWVRGKVTAVGGASVTVTFKGKAMTFAVTADTEIVGPGLGTASRRAGGLKLVEAVKVGEGAEVHYVASGGAMNATEIRTSVSGEAISEDVGDSAAGRITAITASSVTIKSGSGEVMFSVDAKTVVLAPGAGTATRKAQAGGAGPAITDLLKVGEDVVVSFRKSGSTLVAGEVRVRGARPR
jgi:hypothetical protein